MIAAVIIILIDVHRRQRDSFERSATEEIILQCIETVPFISSEDEMLQLLEARKFYTAYYVRRIGNKNLPDVRRIRTAVFHECVVEALKVVPVLHIQRVAQPVRRISRLLNDENRCLLCGCK